MFRRILFVIALVAASRVGAAAQSVVLHAVPLDPRLSAESFLRAAVPYRVKARLAEAANSLISSDSSYAPELRAFTRPNERMTVSDYLDAESRLDSAGLGPSNAGESMSGESVVQMRFRMALVNAYALNQAYHSVMSPTAEGSTTSIAGLGGINASSLITDVVIPAVERQYRATAEATAMNLFQSAICADSVDKSFASYTCAVLGDKSAFDWQIPWASVRAAFERDLNGLPEALAGSVPDTSPLAVKVLVPTGVRFAILARSGADAGEIVHGLKDVGCALMKNGETAKNQWPGLALYGLGVAINVMITDREFTGQKLDQLVNAGLVLFDNQMKAAPCVKKQWTAEASAQVNSLRTEFVNLYYLQRSLRNMTVAARAGTDGSISFTTYMERLQDLLDEGTRIIPWSALNPGSESVEALREHVDSLFALVRQGAETYEAFREGQYPRGLIEVIALSTASGIKLPPGLSRWAPFMADVAQAKTTDELTAAVNSMLAPVGTFREKRRDRAWVASVEAYPSVRAGHEYPLSASAPGDWFAAPSALIGLEVSRGFGSESLGLLVTVVDVGAYLNFGFGGSDKTGDLTNRQQVTLDQVFTPGVFLTLGLTKHYPLAVGGGVSVLQNRRNLVDPQGSKNTRNMWQLSLFVGLDVPMISF